MSTSLEITQKWLDTVFKHDDILAFTQNIHARDVFGNQKIACDIDDAMENGIINFVQFFVQRYKAPSEIGGCEAYQYQVEIRYYKEQVAQEELENEIQAFFETLDDLVTSQLGSRWGDLVTYYRREENFPIIQKVGLIDERPVVGGIYRYFAEK